MHIFNRFGANFWRMPISAFCHKRTMKYYPKTKKNDYLYCKHGIVRIMISQLLRWLFQNRRVDVFCRDQVWRSDKYVFTIDDYEETLMNSILDTLTIKIQNVTTFWNWMMGTIPYP